MTNAEFLEKLQAQAATFAKAVATNEGEWIIKGFIDVYRRIYTISVDTKIVSKVLELLLFPMFVEFGKTHGLKIELCPQQKLLSRFDLHARDIWSEICGGHQEHI